MSSTMTTILTPAKTAVQTGRVNHSLHPPIEKFKTIDTLLRSHAAEKSQKPLICYPVHTASDFEQHTAAEIDSYVDIVCNYYISSGLKPADPSLDKAPVIALLTPSSFEVVLTFFALNRLGYAVLFLSTRLTAPAYARLMGMAECNHIIVPEQLQTVAKDIQTERPGCSQHQIVRRQDWHGQPKAEVFRRQNVDLSREGKKIAWILHSSGSTGFPKPILLTNLQCLANFRKSFALRSFCISPLFHSHALMELGRAFYTQTTMFLGNHSLPVTSANLLSALEVSQPEMVSAVPYVLKLLAEKSQGIDALARTELVMYAGSSCPDDLGDALVARGVNLVANYGATETGQIMTSFRNFTIDKEWSYMRLWQPVADHTLMDEIAPGVFECVGLDGLPSKGPSNSKPPFSDKNPENSFRTADLFTRHPDPAKSNFYKYLSRLDDRITLVNGEKVLPVPMEGTIRHHSLVREAVIFGFQQTMPGVLIFRPDDKATEISDAEYLDAVWPAVEAANARAETFSRIIKELVVIKPADCVYARTDKGTAIRAQVYQQFAEDIKEAYARLSTDASTGPKLSLSVDELETWLLERFRKDLDIPLKDTKTDIFAAGVDSLQTTRIWRAIKKDIELGEGTDSMSQNVVFEKGTVSALAQYLFALRTGEQEVEAGDEVEIMQELIKKYSTFLQHSPTATEMPAKQTVLVTGATGNLGAFIVSELFQRADVADVYTLVRASSPSNAQERVLQSLASRNIHLSSSDLARLHALPADLSLPSLGLDAAVLDKLAGSLTSVIHSAWAVNFNLGVRSFEAQHIRGTHHLISLCLSSRLPKPARFYFCSSVSSASGTPKPATITESAVEDLHHAQKMGYGRSKLVSEHITRNAARATGMESRVLRIGQLSGDTRSAIWNDTEAIALMIRSAITVGALPALDERPSWLPVDTCAKVAVELSMKPAATTDAELVYHLLNPQTFHWTDDLLPALQECPDLGSFDIVSPVEWLDRLAKSEQDPAKNPSVKLLDFWRKKYGGSAGAAVSEVVDDGEPAGLTFETKRTIADCKVLGEVRQPVIEGLIGRYVEAWTKKWAAEGSKA